LFKLLPPEAQLLIYFIPKHIGCCFRANTRHSAWRKHSILLALSILGIRVVRLYATDLDGDKDDTYIALDALRADFWGG
jgi:hypothetical protein